MQQNLALTLTDAYAAIQQDAVGTSYLTADRLWATSSALLALASVVIGGLALARSTGHIGTGDGGRGATVALVTGLIAGVVGALLLATADGGPGSGNGVVGAAASLVLGLVAMAIGGLTLTRSRRTS